MMVKVLVGALPDGTPGRQKLAECTEMAVKNLCGVGCTMLFVTDGLQDDLALDKCTYRIPVLVIAPQGTSDEMVDHITGVVGVQVAMFRETHMPMRGKVVVNATRALVTKEFS